jgi:hypothetical protein
VYLGDGSPDGGSGLPFSLAEVLMRLLCELLGAEEVFGYVNLIWPHLLL